VEILICILSILFVAVVALPIVAITATAYIVDHNKHGGRDPEWQEGYDD
jgi:hypothetical protein